MTTPTSRPSGGADEEAIDIDALRHQAVTAFKSTSDREFMQITPYAEDRRAPGGAYKCLPTERFDALLATLDRLRSRVGEAEALVERVRQTLTDEANTADVDALKWAPIRVEYALAARHKAESLRAALRAIDRALAPERAGSGGQGRAARRIK